jgi:hypothetical protein
MGAYSTTSRTINVGPKCWPNTAQFYCNDGLCYDVNCDTVESVRAFLDPPLPQPTPPILTILIQPSGGGGSKARTD